MTRVIGDQVVAVATINNVVTAGAIKRVVTAAAIEGIDAMPADQIISVGTAGRDDRCGENGVDIPGSAIGKADLFDILVAAGELVFDGEMVISIDLKAQILANTMECKLP